MKKQCESMVDHHYLGTEDKLQLLNDNPQSEFKLKKSPSRDPDKSFFKKEYSPFNIIKDFGQESTVPEVVLSLVIPILNEAQNIPILYKELKEVLEQQAETYEIIFIDDGSRDSSLQILEELAFRDDSVKIIRFRRNYGQTAALSAGFKFATGKIVITADADLQNDPLTNPGKQN